MEFSSSLKIEKVRQERQDSSKKLYREAIAQADGDVKKAAQILGMSRATLYRRLKKYGLINELKQLRH